MQSNHTSCHIRTHARSNITHHTHTHTYVSPHMWPKENDMAWSYRPQRNGITKSISDDRRGNNSNIIFRCGETKWDDIMVLERWRCILCIQKIKLRSSWAKTHHEKKKKKRIIIKTNYQRPHGDIIPFHLAWMRAISSNRSTPATPAGNLIANNRFDVIYSMR